VNTKTYENWGQIIKEAQTQWKLGNINHTEYWLVKKTAQAIPVTTVLKKQIDTGELLQHYANIQKHLGIDMKTQIKYAENYLCKELGLPHGTRINPRLIAKCLHQSETNWLYQLERSQEVKSAREYSF